MITFEVPCNYFNLVPMGMDRCYIIEYSRLLGSNCTDTFLRFLQEIVC